MENIPVRSIDATQMAQNFSDNFSVRDITEQLANSDSVQELHRHDFFYILIINTGIGHHEVDFTSYQVKDYCLIFMRPGQVHQHTLKTGSTGYLMAFNTDFYTPENKLLYQLLRKASSVNFYQFEVNSFQKIYRTITFIHQEYTEKQKEYQTAIKANIELFLVELIRQQDNRTHPASSSYTQERLEEFIALLEHHIGSHKQVSQYADMLNLSPYQLNAITKSTMGKTCSKLINEHIILESKRYLLATSNQINQIALHLGYEDASYFIRFFKKHTGYSPEAFRANFR